MKKSFSKKTVIYISLIAVLFVLLIVMGIILGLQTKEYRRIDATLKDNSGALENITSEIEKYKTEIEKEKQTNSDLQSRLEAAENERKRLEQENADIKKQMELLAAKKRTERLTSILSLGSSLQSGETPTDKVCYLTFDDGPSDNTLRILEILRKYNNIKATFFVLGTAKMEYVPQIHSEGHTIGLHSATHRTDEIYVNEETYLNDLMTISNDVELRIGVKSTVVRFPGGSSNSKNPALMGRLTGLLPSMGYSYFDWNVDSKDAGSASKNANAIVTNVLSQAEGKKSICVLMHDTAAKNATVTALPSIIEGLIQMGFRFESLNAQSYGYHHR